MVSETRAPRAVSLGGTWNIGLRDLIEGARHWRLSYLLGVGEIRRRYARSALGQFWVTASTAITIGALGFVWSQLWRISVTDMMPFIAVSMVTWTFVAGVLNDSPTAFVSAAPIIHNQGIEFSTIIYGLILKHVVILLHNLPIVFLVAFIFGAWPGWSVFGAVLGLGLLIVFLFGLGYLIAVICLRFRDLIQIIQNAVMVLFFVTPVLWRPEQVAASHEYLLKFNPFAVYLMVIQKSFLGHWPAAQEWLIAFGLAIGVMAAAMPVIGWARRRLIYWI